MSASEIETVRRKFRARLEVLLSADELAAYDSYQQSVRSAIARGDTSPVDVSPAAQVVLDTIASDPQATGLDRQLLALMRVEKLPQ